jgi:4-amino-4-deoxy-L-arabinose transferase-like glycosyltransferase
MMRTEASERSKVAGAGLALGDRVSPHEWRAIAGIMVLAAVASAVRLGSHNVWLDEAYSVKIAGLHGGFFWHALLHGDPNMTLYYVLLHFWLPLGTSEAAVRALSALWTVATVPVLYVLARRLLGSTVGWITCILYAVNTFVVTYAQQARGYSLLAFLAVSSTLLFVRATDKPSRWRWVAYVVVSSLAPYVHLYGLLVPASHLVFLALVRRPRPIWRQAAVSWATVALLMVPLAAGVVVNGTSMESWGTRPTPRSVFDAASALSGGHALLLVYGIALVVAVSRGVKSHTSDGRTFQGTGLLVSWLVVPGALAFVGSQVKPEFVDKYLIVSLPPLLMLAAAGLARAVKPPLPVLAVGVVGVATVWGLYGYYRSPSQERWQAAAGYLETHTAVRDLVYAPAEGLPLSYYLMRDARPFHAAVFPTWIIASGLASAAQPIEGLNRVYVVLGPSDVFDPGPWRAGQEKLTALAFKERDSHVFAGQRGDIRIVTYSR